MVNLCWGTWMLHKFCPLFGYIHGYISDSFWQTHCILSGFHPILIYRHFDSYWGLPLCYYLHFATYNKFINFLILIHLFSWTEVSVALNDFVDSLWMLFKTFLKNQFWRRQQDECQYSSNLKSEARTFQDKLSNVDI